MADVLQTNLCRQIIVHPRFPLSRPRPAHRVDWNQLPLDLLLHAAQSLGAQDLCCLASVNRACRDVAGAQHLWKRCFCEKFGAPGHNDPEPSCWKELYRYNHEILYHVLMYRRPEKLLNLGGGVIFINLPVQVQV